MRAENFQDFDEFVASVRGVDCTMMLHNAARHSWQIRAAELAGVLVQLGRLGSGNIVEGQSYSDGYLIYLPLSETCEYLGNGEVIPKNAFLIFEPGSEFRLSTKIEHDWCSIFMPSRTVDCPPAMEGRPSGSDRMICRVTRPSRALASRFRGSVHEILSAARNHPELESSLAANVASAHLIELGSTILGCDVERGTRHDRQPEPRRLEIIRRAEEVMEGRNPISVTELATTVGVAERTLRTAFNQHFGVGPARYLQLRRLHSIYRALRESEPDETSVAQVFVHHGEWEFGRVAGRYRALFGELPSETLRGNRRTIRRESAPTST
jgi:AraC family ethanolamine operon transcriptional activator